MAAGSDTRSMVSLTWTPRACRLPGIETDRASRLAVAKQPGGISLIELDPSWLLPAACKLFVG